MVRLMPALCPMSGDNVLLRYMHLWQVILILGANRADRPPKLPH